MAANYRRKTLTTEQLQQLVRFAEPPRETNQPAVAYRTSGNPRMGTLLAAYLVAKAIALIDARPTTENSIFHYLKILRLF